MTPLSPRFAEHQPPRHVSSVLVPYTHLEATVSTCSYPHPPLPMGGCLSVWLVSCCMGVPVRCRYKIKLENQTSTRECSWRHNRSTKILARRTILLRIYRRRKRTNPNECVGYTLVQVLGLTIMRIRGRGAVLVLPRKTIKDDRTQNGSLPMYSPLPHARNERSKSMQIASTPHPRSQLELRLELHPLTRYFQNLPQLTSNFITSPPKWWITFTGILPTSGRSSGRQTSSFNRARVAWVKTLCCKAAFC